MGSDPLLSIASPLTGFVTLRQTFALRGQSPIDGCEFEGREDGGRCGVGCDLTSIEQVAERLTPQPPPIWVVTT